MHKIEPYYSWNQYYDSAEDELSPFFGKEYNYDLYSEEIYGYYIDPAWDYIGSETLYLKILFTDYDKGFTILEFIGEWNDALHNDIMHLKRNIIEHMMLQGLSMTLLTLCSVNVISSSTHTHQIQTPPLKSLTSTKTNLSAHGFLESWSLSKKRKRSASRRTTSCTSLTCRKDCMSNS